MDRRAFMATIAGGLFAVPLAAEAQQPGKVYRIGYLGTGGNPVTGSPVADRRGPLVDAFRQGLRDLGWIEGGNVAVEYRWADGYLDRLPALASELVKTRVDVIVTLSGPHGAWAALQASRTLPIVAFVSDPVAAGLAVSLARPGGTVTGLATQFEDVVTKQLQLLKEAVPHIARVAILAHHTSLNSTTQKAAEGAVRTLGLNGRVFEIRDVPDAEGVFRTAKAEHADAVHVLPSPAFMNQRSRLAELAARYHLPAMYETREYVEAGGLMSYGPSFRDVFRRAASYVDRIFKGAKPGDLPIEQPTKFELVVNMRTAKALGLTIPQSLLLRADHVIE